MSSSSKEKNSSYPILYYVRGRGRAEIIRLTLAASGLQVKTEKKDVFSR